MNPVNVWGFPEKMKTNGGAFFIIPYLVTVLVVGLPILLLELTLGQQFQTGIHKAIKRVHMRAGGIGIAQAVIAMIVASYLSIFTAYSA
jgi:NSS family neurotransmitter:Na+ symporter